MPGVVIVTELRADWISSNVPGHSSCHTHHTPDGLVLDSLAKELQQSCAVPIVNGVPLVTAGRSVAGHSERLLG